jgi:hypothetical protein
MLELTSSFDALLEANRISSKDTQAQLNEFRQMPWIEPVYKAATLDTLRKVERYWRRYYFTRHARHYRRVGEILWRAGARPLI